MGQTSKQAPSIEPSTPPASTPARAPQATSAQLVAQGIQFLRGAQGVDGSFSKEKDPGISAIALAALLESGVGSNDPTVARGLKHLEKFVRPDGGIYAEGSLHRNYETCVAILAFEATKDQERYGEILRRAAAFVKGIQWDAGEGFSATSQEYGGAGYGSHKRPDLSNTAFLLEALQALGTDPNDPSVQAALVFVSRCQNYPSRYNQSESAKKVADGGFYYTIADGGSSQAGETSDGGLRSYGSMTYAGLKSMIYAGVQKDDERVQAALQWIHANYTLQVNPGMGDAGYFYYLHTFAKALDAAGLSELVDKQGKSHDWRKDLIATLAERQQPDGSWTNPNVRWLEGEPQLVTSYALLALARCN